MAKRTGGPKAAALARTRTLNPNPERVVDEAFGSSELFDARDLVQVKYETVRKVEAHGASVSAAAQAFGLSRQSYCTSAAALAEEGLAGLLPAKPGPQGAHRLTDEVLNRLEGLRLVNLDLSSADLASVVEERFGVSVHPRSIARSFV